MLSRYRHESNKGERRFISYSFLTSALDGSEWSASRSYRALSPGVDPGTHWIGGWVGLRAGLHTEATERILCLLRDQTPVVQSVVRQCTV
jgi:hypothetical protein